MSNTGKMLFLYNPRAGSGSVRTSLSEIVENLSTKYRLDIIPTRRSRHAWDEILENISGYDVLGIAGGDGMLHEAVNGLRQARTDRPLFYIPAGTVNDFGTTHSIHRNPGKASRQLLDGSVRHLDLGILNDEYFAYVAAFGLWTNVSWITPQSEKNRFGALAYYLQSFREVDLVHWENNAVMVHITTDDGEFDEDVIFGAVSNSRFIGGIQFYPKEEGFDRDGYLEGLFIRRPLNIFELEQIIRGLREQNFSGDRFLQIRSRSFVIQTEKPVSWTLDGEFGGEYETVTIDTVPSALAVFLPERSEARNE